MRHAYRQVARSLRIVPVVVLGFVACSLEDGDYVFGGTGGALNGASAGAGQGLGGSSSGGAFATSSGFGGTPTSSAPQAGEAGEPGGGGREAVGGAPPQPGGGTTDTGGSPASSSGTSGVGPAPSAAGAGGAPAPVEGCQQNQICATVTAGSDFPDADRRLVVVLYETEPVITAVSSPWPLATYAPVPDVALSPEEDFVLQQDFTSPAWGTDYAGDRYIAVVAFFSNEERQGRPGVDYWYVTPDPVAIELGKPIELGQAHLTLIPVVDDPDTAGDDAAGIVSCVARRYEDATEGNTCDVSSRTCCIFQVEGGTCGTAACADDGVEFEHACDGPEDCASGQVCCGEPLAAHRCVAADSCNARRVCHTSGECGTASQVCVPATSGIANVGYCVGADPTTPGDDRPGMVQCYPSEIVCSPACCVDEPEASYECNAPTQSCMGTSPTAVHLACDGPEDCSSGQRCCRSETGFQTCGGSCSHAVVCHTDDDCPGGQCGASGECSG